MKQHSVAVILPCRNEEAAVGATVTAFRAALPDAVIYVFDNNSTDNTVNVARAAGAIVRTELTPGKGNVVRRSFADIDADVYVMADGDATYDAAAAPTMIRGLIECQLDMVVEVRRPMLFFGIIGTLLGFVSIVIAVPLAVTYAKTGLVPRLPTAVLSTGLMILAFLSFFSGMILDTVVRGRRELRRLAYLALRPPE